MSILSGLDKGKWLFQYLQVSTCSLPPYNPSTTIAYEHTKKILPWSTLAKKTTKKKHTHAHTQKHTSIYTSLGVCKHAKKNTTYALAPAQAS